jgi:hypothetical protein
VLTQASACEHACRRPLQRASVLVSNDGSRKGTRWPCSWTSTASRAASPWATSRRSHAADLDTQDTHGVKYLRYWVDEGTGKIFCLVEAPDADAADAVHREAHGLVADEIFQVREGV